MSGNIVQPAHPGRQCHEAHPGVPHEVIPPRVHATPPSISSLPSVADALLPPLPIHEAFDVEPDWTRFDEWSDRAMEQAAAALTAARRVDEANKGQLESDRQWSAEVETLRDIARLYADLAIAASPTGAMVPPRFSTTEALAI